MNETNRPWPGLFISFEGIDGSGKSTQARRLSETLRNRGLDPVLTREPGGSPGAEEIRALVLQGDPDRWSAETELLLFTAARRDHLERVIRPALDAGRVVICDRFADSTRMYQGRGGLRDKVDALHNLMIGVEPDLTLLVDMPADAGLSAPRRAPPMKNGSRTLASPCNNRCATAFWLWRRITPTAFA